MAGKHDEMLIYVLHITVLGATVGTNLHLSREKRERSRQRALSTTSVMNGLPLKWSDQPSDSTSGGSGLPKDLSRQGAMVCREL